MCTLASSRYFDSLFFPLPRRDITHMPPYESYSFFASSTSASSSFFISVSLSYSGFHCFFPSIFPLHFTCSISLQTAKPSFPPLFLLIYGCISNMDLLWSCFHAVRASGQLLFCLLMCFISHNLCIHNNL